MRLHRVSLFLFTIALLFPGCASWFIKGEPPEVLVTDITPMDATLFEQRLRVDLRVRNPNDFDSNLYLGMLLKDDQKLDEAYEHLKRDLAKQFTHDVQAYAAAKTPFCDRIVGLARAVARARS